MKKLLRWILIFLVFALMAALSAITALACSPDDNNPEHHENVIQTEEEKPTCLEGGYYVLECTVCGWSCAFSIGDIVPHEFGPWEIVPGKEPTCTKAGEKRAYCSTCNKWYPELVPATGHFWVVWKRVFATCTTPGYTEFVCDDCGADGGTTTTPAKGHSFGAWFTTTQATCTEEGMQKRECATCGATETKSIPKTGHKFGAWFTTTQPTCTEEGMQKRECATCGATETKSIAKTDHNWGAGKVVAQPTTSQEGVMQWICNMCGTIRTNPIPKLKPGTTAAPSTTPTPAPTASPHTSATATPKVSPTAPPRTSATATPKVTPTAPPHTSATATPKVSPTASPRTSATATPKASATASPNAAASASPGISPTASPGASISGTADSDGKNGDRGEKNGFGENAVGKDVPQKYEKNNAQTAERSFSVGKILVFTLVPTFLIVAVVVFLLVWRKKKRQV